MRQSWRLQPFLGVGGPAGAATRVADARPFAQSGALLRNGGFTRESAELALAAGLADEIVFDVAFLANPDLPRRFLLGAPLNAADPKTFYARGAAGYADYPALPPDGSLKQSV